MPTAGSAVAPLQGQKSREAVEASVIERLNFNVSPAVAAEVRGLADELNMSMTQLFRYAVSIFKIAVDESRKNRKLVIADEDGTAIRELVLPGLGSR